MTADLPPHLRRGADAEHAARKFLQQRGLKLLAQNFACAAGELDLVMLDARDLVFVEVRYRKSDDFGGGASSVDAGKQKKLQRAAKVFLQQHSNLEYHGCRFDVVAVSGDGEYFFDWIREAF